MPFLANERLQQNCVSFIGNEFLQVSTTHLADCPHRELPHINTLARFPLITRPGPIVSITLLPRLFKKVTSGVPYLGPLVAQNVLRTRRLSALCPSKCPLLEPLQAVLSYSAQKKAIRFVFKRYGSALSPTSALPFLNLSTPSPRRSYESPKLFHCIINSSCKLPKDAHLTCRRPSSTCHYHALQMAPFYAGSTSTFKFSFCPCTVELWNTLPGQVSALPSNEFLPTSFTGSAEWHGFSTDFS